MIVLLTISITMMAMAGGSALSTTVYQPFNNTAPSEYSGGGCTSDIGGKRNFPGRPDDRPVDASPIGEPWLLLAFALLFGGWKMLIDGVLYIVRDDKIYDCRGVLVH